MRIVAGLGNPGKEYEKNRHNVGFMFLDFMAGRLSLPPFRKKTFYSFAMWEPDDGTPQTMLLKPLTYMNLSGQAVLSALSFYRIPPASVIAVSDDAALPFGKIRIRDKGTDGGQKGLRSIASCIGTTEYSRIRVGIGAPEDDIVRHVLGNFSKSDLELLHSEIFPAVFESLRLVLNGELELAMSRYNGMLFGPQKEEPPESAKP